MNDYAPFEDENEALSMFDEWLDELPLVEFMGYQFDPSDVLKLDQGAYRESFNNWLNGVRND